MSKISTTNGNKEQNKTKRGGGKCHSPVLLLGNIVTCGNGRLRNIILWMEGHGKIYRRKEMRTMNISVTNSEEGRSFSVLNQGKEGQEEKCLSSIGRTEKEKKKKGEKKKEEKKLVNNEGKGRGEQNGSRNGKEVETVEMKGEKGEKPAGPSVEGYLVRGPTVEQGW
jgi:hypothetical protein